MNDVSAGLRILSHAIDATNADRDPEAVLWGRVAKVCEEAGEAIEALIGTTGQNARKGQTHDMLDVAKELMDVAVTALAAHVHVVPEMDPMETLECHVDGLVRRWRSEVGG